MSEEKKELVFLREDNTFLPGFSRDQNLVDHLPAAVYKQTYVPRGDRAVNALVQIKPKFTTPEKIYGVEAEEIYRLLIEDFKSNDRGTSAVIYGPKGAGKSVIAERISNHLIMAGLPTIYLDEKIDFSQLAANMMAIGPCCIIAEEFLKHNANYDKEGAVSERQEGQHPLLTLLSNQDLPKFCFIILDNTNKGLNEFLLNRPDRIRWLVEHKFDRVAVFDEMTKGEPIHDLLRQYLRVYFGAFGDNDGGYDVMKMVVQKARNVQTIEEFVNIMKFWNVPKAHFPTIEVYLDDVWNSRRLTSMHTNKEVDLKIVSNEPGKFPVFTVKNHESEWLDPDQDGTTVDLNEIITPEWILEATKGKETFYITVKDLDFAVSINTRSSKKPTHNVSGFPFIFDVTPPAMREKTEPAKKE